MGIRAQRMKMEAGKASLQAKSLESHDTKAEEEIYQPHWLLAMTFSSIRVGRHAGSWRTRAGSWKPEAVARLQEEGQKAIRSSARACLQSCQYLRDWHADVDGESTRVAKPVQ